MLEEDGTIPIEFLQAEDLLSDPSMRIHPPCQKVSPLGAWTSRQKGWLWASFSQDLPTG